MIRGYVTPQTTTNLRTVDIVHVRPKKVRTNMFDLTVVGHFTVDQIVAKHVPQHFTLGGSSTYASLAAKRMGADVSVVSKVGPDFPEEYLLWLARNGVSLAGLHRCSAPTTCFILKYEDGTRTLRLKRLCEPISPEDFPGDLKTKAIHLGPVAGEIPVETASHAARISNLVSLDPQGFVRKFDREGYASDKLRMKTSVLRHVSILKASESELKAALGADDVWKAAEAALRCGPSIVIVTRGIKGAYLLSDKNRYEIPACRPRVIVDPTGAGDAFIGAFMAEYARRKDPLWCAAAGSAASSFVVEGSGAASFGSKKGIVERAQQAYQRVRKLE